MVILSHSFELIDHNRARELLTRAFGTLSFGEVGVDGFFLISGYLVTKSLIETQSPARYLWKRILRIWPGYLAAFCMCGALAAALGGQIEWHTLVSD
jgi:peptidoglycan/LPS O-acetylase OafA/YrhL